MPEMIRTSGGHAHPRQGGFLAAGVVAAAAAMWPRPADAAEPPLLSLRDLAVSAYRSVDRHEAAILLPMFGLILFAVISAIMLVRTRRRAARYEAGARDEIAALREQVDRANALLLSEPQVMVDWPAAADQPGIDGDPTVLGITPSHRLLAFGTWLDPGKARDMERALDALRSRGAAFSMTMTTLSGHPIEAQGRAVGGHAVLRLKDASAVTRDLLQHSPRGTAPC